MGAIDGALVLWFGLTLPAAVFAAYDLATRTPAMTVMRWGWVLVILYTGPIGLFVYLVSCREPLPRTHASRPDRAVVIPEDPEELISRERERYLSDFSTNGVHGDRRAVAVAPVRAIRPV